jgi:hypothetical protein
MKEGINTSILLSLTKLDMILFMFYKLLNYKQKLTITIVLFDLTVLRFSFSIIIQNILF